MPWRKRRPQSRRAKPHTRRSKLTELFTGAKRVRHNSSRNFASPGATPIALVNHGRRGRIGTPSTAPHSTFLNRPMPHLGAQLEASHAFAELIDGSDEIPTRRVRNTFHVSLFAYYLEKLKATREGDGSLLDHSAILYGSG